MPADPTAAAPRDEGLLARRILVLSRAAAWPPNAREKDYHEFGYTDNAPFPAAFFPGTR
jgi:hypothetical protein